MVDSQSDPPRFPPIHLLSEFPYLILSFIRLLYCGFAFFSPAFWRQYGVPLYPSNWSWKTVDEQVFIFSADKLQIVSKFLLKYD